MNNKKANFIHGVMGFLFIAQIFIVILMFMGFGLHFLMNDYAITPAVNAVNTFTTTVNMTNQTNTLVSAAANDYLAQAGVYDIMIFTLIIIVFITSCVTAVKSQRLGFWSFYGYLTIGYMLLSVLIMFSLQIRDWILNEIFYKVITETFSARLTLWFINYPYVWASIWFITILVLSYVDLTALVERAGLLNFDGSNQGGGEFQE